jgi:hypothetical protein
MTLNRQFGYVKRKDSHRGDFSCLVLWPPPYKGCRLEALVKWIA